MNLKPVILYYVMGCRIFFLEKRINWQMRLTAPERDWVYNPGVGDWVPPQDCVVTYVLRKGSASASWAANKTHFISTVKNWLTVEHEARERREHYDRVSFWYDMIPYGAALRYSMVEGDYWAAAQSFALDSIPFLAPGLGYLTKMNASTVEWNLMKMWVLSESAYILHKYRAGGYQQFPTEDVFRAVFVFSLSRFTIAKADLAPANAPTAQTVQTTIQAGRVVTLPGQWATFARNAFDWFRGLNWTIDAVGKQISAAFLIRPGGLHNLHFVTQMKQGIEAAITHVNTIVRNVPDAQVTVKQLWDMFTLIASKRRFAAELAARDALLEAVSSLEAQAATATAPFGLQLLQATTNIRVAAAQLSESQVLNQMSIRGAIDALPANNPLKDTAYSAILPILRHDVRRAHQYGEPLARSVEELAQRYERLQVDTFNTTPTQAELTERFLSSPTRDGVSALSGPHMPYYEEGRALMNANGGFWDKVRVVDGQAETLIRLRPQSPTGFEVLHPPYAKSLELGEKAMARIAKAVNDPRLSADQFAIEIREALDLLYGATPWYFGTPSILESGVQALFHVRYQVLLKNKSQEPFWRSVYGRFENAESIRNTWNVDPPAVPPPTTAALIGAGLTDAEMATTSGIFDSF